MRRALGVALFERTSRHVALTPVGRQLHHDVRAGHEQVLRGVAAAVAAGHGVDGVLSVGLEAPAVADLLVEVLDCFRRRHPGTEVRLVEADFQDPLEQLRSGEVDVLVTNAPVEEPGLVAGPVVLREPAVLAVPARHRLAPRDTVSLDDLGGEVVLRAGRRAWPYWQPPPTEWTTPAGDVVHRGRPASTFQELLAAIARSEGICPVAAHATTYFARPTVVLVPFDAAAPPIEWCLTWRAAHATQRVRTFVGMASQTTR